MGRHRARSRSESARRGKTVSGRHRREPPAGRGLPAPKGDARRRPVRAPATTAARWRREVSPSAADPEAPTTVGESTRDERGQPTTAPANSTPPLWLAEYARRQRRGARGTRPHTRTGVGAARTPPRLPRTRRDHVVPPPPNREWRRSVTSTPLKHPLESTREAEPGETAYAGFARRRGAGAAETSYEGGRGCGADTTTTSAHPPRPGCAPAPAASGGEVSHPRP